MEEFIKQLSIETPYSQSYASQLVSTIIQMGGDLESIKEVYADRGFVGIEQFQTLLSFAAFYETKTNRT